MADVAPSSTPLKPSGFVGEPDVESYRPGEPRRRALLRGTIVHRLMQSLPDIPQERRADAAHRHIERQDKAGFSASERAEIAGQALAILDAPHFAVLFAPGSQAEVPIVGRVGGHTVTGIVDRLVVTPEAILIADYKTNRPAPRTLAETRERHPGYIRQLALYRAVLSRLYPGRLIRAALVWTDNAALSEIPAEVLDAALASLTNP
jgi:ATP-dependent helicase/nuclease subunit A